MSLNRSEKMNTKCFGCGHIEPTYSIIRFSQKGVGIVAVILIVAMLSLMGLTITTLVATGSVSKTNDLVREQAFGLAQAGLEFALMRIQEGVNPDGYTRNLGNGQFTVNYDPSGVITVHPLVSALYGSAAPTFAIQGPAASGTLLNSCLVVDTATALIGGAGDNTLSGITMLNNCLAALNITGMSMDWRPDLTANYTEIVMGGTSVWSGTGGQNTVVNFDTPYNIAECTTVPLTSISYSANMSGENFDLYFLLSDGSTKHASTRFAASDQASCLSVDLTNAAVGGMGYAQLRGGTLTNTCAIPTSITVQQMQIAWTPNTNPQLKKIEFSNNGLSPRIAFSGVSTSGSSIDFRPSSVETISYGSSLAQDYLEFDRDIRGYNFSITYIMDDGSQRTIPVNLYSADMASCLNVLGDECTIRGSGYSEIQGQKWQNTCAQRVVIDKVQSSWSRNSKLTQIVVNGAGVFTGNGIDSGAIVDISNVDIPGNTTFTVNRYRFTGSMSGQQITSPQIFTFAPSMAAHSSMQTCP